MRMLRIAVVLTVGMTLTACADREVSTQGREDEGANAAAPQERKVLYWKSPMDPTFVSKAPGMDPMGMDLVPVYEGDAPKAEAGSVRIDPTVIQNIGVKTVVVRRKLLSREIRTVGRIAYDERKVRRISPKIGGWIERQRVNFTGQVVTKGERLLQIYSPELVATQEEYLIALRYRERLRDSLIEDALVGSEGLVRAAETRLRYWDITNAQIRALRDRGELTRTMSLYAPFDGIIIEKNVLEGGYVTPGQSLYGIADISTVWVYADIYEYEAPWLELGQEATMQLAYRPGASYVGKVLYVYPYLQQKTRTIQVRMEFENTADFDLKPDMWADVTLQSALGHESLAVPVQAVIRTGKRDIVLIALEGGRFAPRELRLGAEVGDEFEVLDGLEEGARVVTSGQFLINSESNLQAAVAKMLQANEPAPPAAATAGAPESAPDHGDAAHPGER